MFHVVSMMSYKVDIYATYLRSGIHTVCDENYMCLVIIPLP